MMMISSPEEGSSDNEPMDEVSLNRSESEKSPIISSIQETATNTQISLSTLVNGMSFYFTEQPNAGPGWNNNNSCSLMNPAQQSEDEDEDTFQEYQDTIKNYDMFESKLKDGFLEASNLGLICVPPAMFDYNPPLQRVDLKDNKIESLPDHFFDELPLLSWCDMRYNKLLSLPEMNKKHDCLNVLLVQDNQLCDLPYSLAYASNLHTLGWTNNHIIEPPRYILLQGCRKTLDFMRTMLLRRIPVDDQGNLTPLDTDAQLREDLSKTAVKSTLPKRSKSKTSISTDKSGKSDEEKKNEERAHQKRIDRIKYTWNLWKDIPYEGVSNHRLFEKSLQEVRDEVKTKLNQEKEAVLQRMKDTAVLGRFRWDTKMLQMKGPQKQYEGIDMPFGTDADILRPKPHGVNITVSSEDFRTTVTDCIGRLQEFALNPVPLNDAQKSYERLKEVEEVQRKLLDMKVVWSVKNSDPA